MFIFPGPLYNKEITFKELKTESLHKLSLGKENVNLQCILINACHDVAVHLFY